VHLFPSPDIGLFGRRQRHVRGHRIPVSIVTGAGPVPQDRDTAVVIDTFGAYDTVPFPGGCTCCTVRAKLQNAMLDLLAERDQKAFSRIAIKTGEDLAPILRTFASERAFGGEYYVDDVQPLDGNRFMLTEDVPLSWDAFSRFVTTLTVLRGPDLLHAKGLLNIAGCRGPVAVEFLQHLAHRPVELEKWPDGRRESHLEFVTRGIDEKAVRRLFDSVRALA
jgi:G3E family GTPase